MRSLLLILLAGCASEQTQLLESWVGVYRFEGYRLDETSCGPDGPETDPPTRFLVVDAISREGVPSTLNLRLCTQSTGDCGAPWFSIAIDVLTEGRITGRQAEYVLLPTEACTLQWANVELTRQGDALHAEIESFAEDLGFVETEEDCVDALEQLADEATCVAYHVIDGERLPDG